MLFGVYLIKKIDIYFWSWLAKPTQLLELLCLSIIKVSLKLAQF